MEAKIFILKPPYPDPDDLAAILGYPYDRWEQLPVNQIPDAGEDDGDPLAVVFAHIREEVPNYKTYDFIVLDYTS